MDDDVSNLIIAQLLYLESEDPDREIFFYINSPGGLVSAGLAIYDTMQYIKPPVCTVCMGQAASMGALIMAAGRTGAQVCVAPFQNTYTSALGSVSGAGNGYKHSGKRDDAVKNELIGILAKHTGQPIEKIALDTERDYYMTGDQAKEYGLIDEVITKRDVIK